MDSPGPLALALVTARLAGTTGLMDIGGAVEYFAAREALKRWPAAFVLPAKDTAAPNAFADGALDQQVVARYGVILAVRNLRDAKGEAAMADLTPLRQAVWTQLLGWVPAAGFSPCTYGGGRLLDLDEAAQVLWWVDEFDTDYHVRVI